MKRAIGAGQRDRVIAGVNTDGSVQLIKADALRESCTDAAACAFPISERTNNGWRVNLVPGDTGPAWAVDKYGDILIDGVPLVFDLTQPPIIIDAPGATAQDDAAMILAGIDHESATHAVWTVDTTGKLSQPGLLRLTSSVEGRRVWASDGRSFEEGDATNLDLIVVTDDGAGADYRATTLQVGAVDLAAGIGGDTPVSIQVSDNDGGGNSLFEGTDPNLVAQIMANDNAAFNRSATRGETTVLTELTAAEAAQTFRVEFDGETASIYRSSAGGNGELCGSTEHFLTANDPHGTMENALFGEDLLLSADFTGKIKRIKIKKKRIGSNFRLSGDEEQPDPTYELVVEEMTAPGELANSVGGRVLDGGDFNGDGLVDAVVTDGSGGGAIVMFSDGRGGFLSDVMTIPGGPTIVWPSGANASTSGNGKGTRKASTRTLQNNPIKLL